MDISIAENNSDDIEFQLPIKDGRKPKHKSYRKKVETVWSHESIIKLIMGVEVRRSLWDDACPEYKLPKDHLWQEVADSLQLSVNDCKGKWTNLRTSFKFNLQKYKKKKSDPDSDEQVQIVWRYFKPMMFLETRKVHQPSQSISSIKLESAIKDESIISDMSYTEEFTSIEPCTSEQRNSNSASRMSSTLSNSGHRTDVMEMAIEELQTMQSQPKDPCTVLSEYIAAELVSLSPELAAFARSKLRRAFNDIMDEVDLMVQQQTQTQ